MSDMTKEELGLPWKDDGGGVVTDKAGMHDALVCASKDKLAFILTACNSYHTMREALEEYLHHRESHERNNCPDDRCYGCHEYDTKIAKALKGAKP